MFVGVRYHATIRRFLSKYWPEAMLLLVAAFFVLRELDTFPQIWTDEGLYVIVARAIASGRGYVLPTLTYDWSYPNVVSVGPPLLLPVALSIRLLGLSLFAARLPMALYLLATTCAFHWFTRRVAGLRNARFATGLLVTLSAFVNTGKPVMGEIPAFFFLAAGLLGYCNGRSVRTALLVGVAFGLSAMTKTTFGLLFPALFLAFCVAVARRERSEARLLFIVGLAAVATYAPWPLLLSMHGDIAAEMRQSALSQGGSNLFFPLIHFLPDFLRFQFVYFYVIAVLGALGMWALRRSLRLSLAVFIAAFAALHVMHVLSVPNPPWYRYFLPAHLILLPFVPSGMLFLVRKKWAGALILSAFILTQGWWQLTYHGATKDDEVVGAVQEFDRRYASTELVFSQPELFALLPDNPHWQFITREILRRDYVPLPGLPLRQDQHCLPVVSKSGEEDLVGVALERVVPVFRRYVIIEPDKGCASHGFPADAAGR